MTKKQLEKFKKILLGKREEIVKKGRSMVNQNELAPDMDNINDEMDMASSESDQALKFRFLDKDYKLLREIDHALEKFEDGSYGICEGTGEPIDIKRLEIRPWTRYSHAYKEQLEEERKKRK